MPEEVPEIPVHYEWWRRFQRFRSTVSGNSGGSGTLYYTVLDEVLEVPVHCAIEQVPEVRFSVCFTRPEEVSDVPVHCVIECQRKSGCFGPLYYTVPEEDAEVRVHCLVQCQRRFHTFQSIVLLSGKEISG